MAFMLAFARHGARFNVSVFVTVSWPARLHFVPVLWPAFCVCSSVLGLVWGEVADIWVSGGSGVTF